jgi:hypothetical protein
MIAQLFDVMPLLALAAALGVPAPAPASNPDPAAAAQAGLTAPDQGKLQLFSLDLAVPDSPAFAVLGATPENVTRPTSPKDLATSLLNGVDEQGHFVTGVAIDVTPKMVFGGRTLQWRDYHDNYGQRLAARTQVSYATTKGATGDDQSVRMALGVHVTPWDEGDSRMDAKLSACFDKEGAELTKPIPPGSTDEQIAQELARRETAARTVADACRAEARRRNWAASAWSLGFAQTWTSPSGASSDLAGSGVGMWTSLALGLGAADRPSSQLILHARYRSRDIVADPSGLPQFIEQNKTFAGARYRFGSPDFAGTIEAGWTRTSPQGGVADTTYHLSFGAEYRLGENGWLVFAVGGDGGGDALQSHPLSVLSSFKWGFAPKSQLADVYKP